jgi:hypothetical protein
MAATFATAEIAEAVRSARTERLGGTVGSAKALLILHRAVHTAKTGRIGCMAILDSHRLATLT